MSTKTCSFIDRAGKSCPNLAESGGSRCPAHERPRSASWSRDRDTSAQGRERKATLQRDGYTCRRCGHRDPSGKSLDAHHVAPGRLVTVCNACHVAIDPNARRRT